MTTALIPAFYIFLIGVIFYAGMMAQQVRDHDRRLSAIEGRMQNIDENIAKLLALFQNGGPS